MLSAPAFGARFYQPVDHYQLVERALKYAILFIALAFLVFFVVETVSPRQLHVVHYALVGAAQALFYLLLLSFSGLVGFAAAYLVAAGATRRADGALRGQCARRQVCAPACWARS